ncbi:MAG: fimbrillin family protein [Marinifilaceae bacterium]
MRHQLFCCAAAVLLIAGCAKEEAMETATTKVNPNEINFTGTTSRALGVHTLATMQSDATGFKVFGTSGAGATAWYAGLDGTNNYKYTAAPTNAWGWTTAPGAQWPTVTTGYPMNFYAHFPAAANGFTATSTAPNLTAAIVVQSTAAQQVDFLAAKATTVSRPGDGFLPLTFNHIMNKVNVAFIVGTQCNVFVQSVRVVNVKGTNTYNYVTGAWAGAATTPASYDYYNSTTTPRSVWTATTADETTANPMYTPTTTPTLASATLMLMPQTLTGWTPTVGTAPAATDTYLEVVYRVASPNDPNNVGYASSINHPSYATGGAVTPLFVKVAFPLTGTWTAGQGYVYNVYLGTVNTTGGYYLSNNFIDQNGADSGLRIHATKQIGNPVANGNINFDVTASPWPADSTVPVGQ